MLYGQPWCKNSSTISFKNAVSNSTSNVFWGGATDFKTGCVLSLAPNIGLVFGGILLVAFGSRLRHWKWTLTGSVVTTVIFGALLALGRPDRKAIVRVQYFRTCVLAKPKYFTSCRRTKSLMIWAHRCWSLW